jgi:hypothetical protein
MFRSLRMLATSFTLLSVLILSGTLLYAQEDGFTPATAITVTAASSGNFYNSRRGEVGVKSDLTAQCTADVSFTPPYYDDFWFKYSAAKDEKLIYFEALTLQGTDDDFLAILFVYEQTESGLSLIGCHGDGAAWILSLRPGRTYLFRVVALSSIWWEGDWSAYLGHGGWMQLYILSSPIGVYRYRAEGDRLDALWNDQLQDLIVIYSTSPNFFCDPNDPTTTPVKWDETLLRNGVDHFRSGGNVYTKVYRPTNFEEAVNSLLTDYCDFMRNDSSVGEGIAKLANNDNNKLVTGNKSDTWDVSLMGHLAAATNECSSGAARLQFHYTEYCPKEGCDTSFLRNMFGPQLTCAKPK